jgi:1-acyl-sn-glycerol-3-phosphate acyltransferase
MTAWWRERGVDEPVYGMFHSAFLALPGVGPYVRKAGALEAGWENAQAVLERDGIVLVYPGGDHEAFRPFRDRDRIDFAGRTGFVRLALRAGVPIVPAVSCGAHDTVLVMSRGERLAAANPVFRRFRIKAMPFLLGPPWGISPGWPMLQLPAKIVVQLGAPIDLAADFGSNDPGDDALAQKGYDLVTDTMQQMLDQLAQERPGQRWLT